MKTIQIGKFAARHFDKSFGGTQILDMNLIQVENILNDIFTHDGDGIFSTIKENVNVSNKELAYLNKSIVDGYAPFCKLLFVQNFTEAKTGVLPITLENYQYIRHKYSARTKDELPILTTYLQLPPGIEIPRAEYLCFVVYDKAQIDYEDSLQVAERRENIDAEWCVVAILGQMEMEEHPMKPITMMRNALGAEEGGSGHKLDREAYMKAVEFWSKNVTIGS